MTSKERAAHIYETYRQSIVKGQKIDLISLIAHHIEEASLIAHTPPTSCPDHPRYTAKRTPKTLCKICWEMYILK